MLALIRWKNIVIIWVTIFLLGWSLVPFDLLRMNWLQLILLAIMICAQAVYGYLVNDLYDRSIDQLNRPDKISLQFSRFELFENAMLALVISFLAALGIRNHQWEFLLITALCTIQLWAYSKYFKCTPFLGNITVSIFCAGVPFTLLLLFPKQVNPQWIWAYVFFAFWSTLIREIVKDMEDIQGDRQLNCSTFPVKMGFQKGKELTLVLSLIFIASIVFGGFFLRMNRIERWLYIGLILIPFALLPLYIYQSKIPKDYKRMSGYIKFFMILGLVFIVLIKWI